MAKATKIVETIVEEKDIVLELTIQEAEVLRFALNRIGGDPVFHPDNSQLVLKMPWNKQMLKM